MTIKEHAEKRYKEHAKTMGEVDVENDPRHFGEEALEELADCLNYVEWQCYRGGVGKIQLKAIRHYLGMAYGFITIINKQYDQDMSRVEREDAQPEQSESTEGVQ